MGRSSHLRQRGGGSRFLGGEPPGSAADGIGCGRQLRFVRIGDDHLADGPADAGAHQTPGPFPVPQLPEHDQTMAQRTHGARNARTTTMKNPKVVSRKAESEKAGKRKPEEMRSAEWGVRNGAAGFPLFRFRAFRFSAPGFTLIELLIVISIMAILAAMIIPISGAVSRNRIKAKARAELEQVATGIELYKAKLGAYPPDNPRDPSINQLYFE